MKEEGHGLNMIEYIEKMLICHDWTSKIVLTPHLLNLKKLNHGCSSSTQNWLFVWYFKISVIVCITIIYIFRLVVLQIILWILEMFFSVRFKYIAVYNRCEHL